MGTTAKTVKAKPYKPMGVGVKTSTSAKRVKVGDANTTSARTAKAGETELQRRDRVKTEAVTKRVMSEEAAKDKARRDLLKRGYITGTEAQLLKGKKKDRKSLI